MKVFVFTDYKCYSNFKWISFALNVSTYTSINVVPAIDHFETGHLSAEFSRNLLSGVWHVLNLMLRLVIWIDSILDGMSSACKAFAIEGIWKINSDLMASHKLQEH